METLARQGGARPTPSKPMESSSTASHVKARARRDGGAITGIATRRRSSVAESSNIFSSTSRGSRTWRTASKNACLAAFESGSRCLASPLRVFGAQHSNMQLPSPANGPCEATIPHVVSHEVCSKLFSQARFRDMGRRDALIHRRVAARSDRRERRQKESARSAREAKRSAKEATRQSQSHGDEGGKADDSASGTRASSSQKKSGRRRTPRLGGSRTADEREAVAAAAAAQRALEEQCMREAAAVGLLEVWLAKAPERAAEAKAALSTSQEGAAAALAAEQAACAELARVATAVVRVRRLWLSAARRSVACVRPPLATVPPQRIWQ